MTSIVPRSATQTRHIRACRAMSPRLLIDPAREENSCAELSRGPVVLILLTRPHCGLPVSRPHHPAAHQRRGIRSRPKKIETQSEKVESQNKDWNEQTDKGFESIDTDFGNSVLCPIGCEPRRLRRCRPHNRCCEKLALKSHHFALATPRRWTVQHQHTFPRLTGFR